MSSGIITERARPIITDKFIWKVVPAREAQIIFDEELFELFELHEDGSESMIETDGQINEAMTKNDTMFAIEVGFLNEL